MKTLFLLLDLLTDSGTIRGALHSCLTVALVCVAILSLLGTYQLLRRSCLARLLAPASRA